MGQRTIETIEEGASQGHGYAHQGDVAQVSGFRYTPRSISVASEGTEVFLRNFIHMRVGVYNLSRFILNVNINKIILNINIVLKLCYTNTSIIFLFYNEKDGEIG